MAGQARTMRGSGKTNRAALLLALVLGAAAALLTFVFLQEQSNKTSTTTNVVTKPVVVAKAEIPVRTRITAEMVDVRAIPETAAHPQAFTKPDQVVGQITSLPVAKGEQILTNKVALSSALAAAKEGSATLPLSQAIPPGKRGVAVKVSELIGVGGLILPGDFVDVIALFEVESAGLNTADPRSKEDPAKIVAVTLLQNVEVLAVAQAVTEIGLESGADTGTSGQKEQPSAAQPTAIPGRVPLRSGKPNPAAGTVTLAVTPEQAALLAMAEKNGTLRLSLRPFGESDTTPVRTVPGTDLIPLPKP